LHDSLRLQFADSAGFVGIGRGFGIRLTPKGYRAASLVAAFLFSLWGSIMFVLELPKQGDHVIITGQCYFPIGTRCLVEGIRIEHGQVAHRLHAGTDHKPTPQEPSMWAFIGPESFRPDHPQGWGVLGAK
jgi:hypothetical protein